jgi:hypothetical protein
MRKGLGHPRVFTTEEVVERRKPFDKHKLEMEVNTAQGAKLVNYDSPWYKKQWEKGEIVPTPDPSPTPTPPPIECGDFNGDFSSDFFICDGGEPQNGGSFDSSFNASYQIQ